MVCLDEGMDSGVSNTVLRGVSVAGHGIRQVAFGGRMGEWEAVAVADPDAEPT